MRQQKHLQIRICYVSSTKEKSRKKYVRWQKGKARRWFYVLVVERRELLYSVILYSWVHSFSLNWSTWCTFFLTSINREQHINMHIHTHVHTLSIQNTILLDVLTTLKHHHSKSMPSNHSTLRMRFTFTVSIYISKMAQKLK